MDNAGECLSRGGLTEPSDYPQTSGDNVLQAGIPMKKMLNKSMDTNRRNRLPLDVARKMERAVHAPAVVSTAVGHLTCYAVTGI